MGEYKYDSNSQANLSLSISKNSSDENLKKYKKDNKNISEKKKKINNNLKTVNSKNKNDKKSKKSLEKELKEKENNNMQIFEESDEDKIIQYYVSGNFEKIKNSYLQKINEKKKIEEKESKLVLNCFSKIETSIKIHKKPRRNFIKEKKKIIKNHKFLEEYLKKYLQSINPLIKSKKIKVKNKNKLNKKLKNNPKMNNNNHNYTLSNSDSSNEEDSIQNIDNVTKPDRCHSHENLKDKLHFKKKTKLIYDNTYLLKNINQKNPSIKKEINDIINSDSSNVKSNIVSIDKNDSDKNIYISKNLIKFHKKKFIKNKDGKRFRMIYLKPEKDEKKKITQKKKETKDEEKNLIFEKKLYEFFAKIQYLKNKGDDEFNLLIDEEIDKMDNPDTNREMRLNSFYEKFQDRRNFMMSDNKYKLKRAKLRFMSPIIFSSYTTRNGYK